MYTPDQYSRAKAQVDRAPPEAQAILRQRIGEYESSNLRPGEARGAEGERPTVDLAEPPAKAPEPKLSHPSDPSLATAVAARAADPYVAGENALAADPTHDYSLPSASQLKGDLYRKPEVAGGIGSTLKAIGEATVHKGGLAEGALATSYFEPSAAQFARDQAALLRAKGIQPNTSEFDKQFNEYKDRKWAQAHDAAEAEGRPLVRREFVHHDTLSWGRLGDFLANSADTAAAFGKGMLAGRTLQASRLLAPARDLLFNTDSEAEDAAQAERHPYASFAGELKGAASGPLANITKAATIPRLAGSASMGTRVLGAGLAGVAGAEADNASRSVAAGASDALHGGNGLHSAKDQFVSHLAGSALLGGGLGAIGHLGAEGLNKWQQHVAESEPAIGQLRRGGGDTDIIRGIRPGEEVAKNLEAAREPLPGENKTSFGGTPTEYAVGKVREPLAQAHTDQNAATFERLGAEKQAAVEADPKLQNPISARQTAQTIGDWVRSKLQPNAPGYIPGMKLQTADIAPGGDLGEASKLAQQIYKPRLVTASEAKAAAERNGGFAVSVDEAKRLGFRVDGLDDTGVPAGAPPIEDATTTATEAASVPKLLPKYPRDTHVGDIAKDVTPEEAAAVQRYTWGKREPGDADLVNSYLERAPATPLPHVYRGIAMKPDQAHDMMASGSFSTGDAPASVSSDPTVARSFAARNRNPGDIGITLKLEGASARNITPLAHEQVGVERELLLPAGKRFEIVSKHPDPANPGDWIVVAREAAPEAMAGSTARDVFGVPAEKPSASPVDRLKPRPGRAKPTAAPTPGSDWDRPDYDKARFDFIFHDHAVADPFGPPKGDDITPTRPTNSPPMVERHPASRGAPSSAPPELRAPAPEATPSPQATQAQAAGLPPTEFKVVLEPQEYNALKFEDILGDIDRKAGYAKATGAPDPQWEKVAQAIRKDREQFGPGWTGLIGKHHEELNGLEQRSFHAGMAADKAYPEMPGGAQQRLTGKLEGFPGKKDSNDALRDIAAKAPPEVQRDLEALGATNAYQELRKGTALKTAETVGGGGIVGRLTGVGGFLKPRADALARGLSAGPTGEPTITPRLKAYLDKISPPGPKWLPGVPALGGGALGLKAGVAYNALTPQQRALLAKLIETAAKPAGATP